MWNKRIIFWIIFSERKQYWKALSNNTKSEEKYEQMLMTFPRHVPSSKAKSRCRLHFSSIMDLIHLSTDSEFQRCNSTPGLGKQLLQELL
jgi:hypothetical protein